MTIRNYLIPYTQSRAESELNEGINYGRCLQTLEFLSSIYHECIQQGSWVMLSCKGLLDKKARSEKTKCC